jgi:hypothetical protein
MLSYYRTLGSAARYALILTLVLALWFGSLYIRNRMLAPCSDPGRCTAFVDYSLHDPFCLIDPTCVSPFYNPAWSGGVAPHWQGLQWVTDPLLISGNAVTMLAVPNYIVFMALASLLIVIVARHVNAGRAQKEALTIVLAWSTLEIGSWFFRAAALDPGQGASFVLTSSVLLLASMFLLGSAVNVSLRLAKRRPG